MSQVTIIPTRLAQDAARNPRNAGTVDLFYIAGRLGQAHRSVGRLVKLVDALIAEQGFPAPFPVWSNGRLVTTAHRDSTWCDVAVHCWFNDRLPPAARAVVAGAERAAIDRRLAANAATLFEGDVA